MDLLSSQRGPRVDVQMDTLRSLRIKKGWTQLDLAYHAHLTPSTVSRLERGWQAPNLATVLALAMALDVPMERLSGCLADNVRPSRMRVHKGSIK